jgi:hypothetical protein
VIRLIEFDWDRWNLQKNEIEHGVSRLEAESAFHDPRYKLYQDTKHSVAREARYILYGTSLEKPRLDGRIHPPGLESPRRHGSPGVTKRTAYL